LSNPGRAFSAKEHCARCQRNVCPQQQLSAVDGIGDGPAHQTEPKHRDELEQGDQSNREW